MVMGTSTWSLNILNPKKLEYMQYYMMLEEQCDHLVAKAQATVTRTNEDQILVCLLVWLDYSFAWT